MHIERIYKSSIEKRSVSFRNRLGTILLLIAAAICLGFVFLVVAFSKNKDESLTTTYLVCIVLSLVFYLTSFFGGILLKWNSQLKGLIAFARTSDGALFHVCVPREDIYTESKLVKTPVDTIKNAKIIDTRFKREAFFCSEELDQHLKNIIEESAPDPLILQIQRMENICVTRKRMDGLEIMFTTGKHQKIFKTIAFSTLNDYKELTDFFSRQTSKVNYSKHKEGDYLIE